MIVSVVIPVYNQARYLSECLDSVLAQTLREIEAICVDDGSTDGSGRILDEYAAHEVRVKVVHQKNAGAGPARNVGEWLRATGNPVFDPERPESVVAALEAGLRLAGGGLGESNRVYADSELSPALAAKRHLEAYASV